MRTTAPICLAALLLVSSAAAQKHPFGVDDMLAMQRLSEAQVSPDGKWVVFTLRTTDFDANKGRNDLWLAAVDGSGARQLTKDPANETGARWLPDSKTILFLSTQSGSSQVWRLSIDGGAPSQVTDLPLDVGNLVVFPDGKKIAFTLEVDPTIPTKGTPTPVMQTAAALEKEKEKKVKARIYDRLPIRHWDTWETALRSHWFVWPLEESEAGKAVLGGAAATLRCDLLDGIYADAPTKPFGGTEEIAISPEGKEVLFASKIRPGRESMWSTNVDLWRVDVAADGKSATAPECVTTENPALDNVPSYSPDGKLVAWLAMARPGYESDRQRIVVMDRSSRAKRVLAESWDRSAQSIAWSGDSKTIYTVADHFGNKSVFAVDVESGKVAMLLEKGNNEFVGEAGDRLVILHDELALPAELFSMNKDGSDRQRITHVNDARCAAVEWGSYEQFTFTGAHGDTVYGYVMKPAGMQEGTKYPIAFLVHGGPQGSFGNHFHYRWNPEFYAGRGFASVFIDFHGSTGYGQKFTDAINGDWGGAPFEDLMKGLDAALAKYPFLDGGKCAALGASYGGYMMNWINGNTDRFKCIVTHASNIDERMAYFDTEELWFPEWEHGGVPWEKPEGYAKQNPVDFVKNWKTPTLVTHGANDFRVVDTQGISVFTALQRKGVPSRLVYFPDENHWVLKPQNSKLWHEEVGKWLDQWCK